MNRTQIAVLGLALAAFGGAYYAFNSLSVQQTAPRIAAQQAPTMPTERVLVASANIPLGGPITPANTLWRDWPKASLNEQMILEAKNGPSNEDTKGALAREPILKDEPIRRDRIVKAGAGGLLAAILPAGMRAVNVNIDGNGGQNGQPIVVSNDKVDVIRIARDDEATKARGVEVMTSQTIVENVLVLAATGATATLELTPDQAQLVYLALKQSGAGLRLSLRSILDSAGDPKTVEKPKEAATGGVTVVRFGTAN